MKSVALISGLLSLFALACSQTTPAPALPCPNPPPNATICPPARCRCSGTDIPGNLVGANIPQIVFLTFDDAIRATEYPLYEELLFNRTNPNNASISATFFTTHEYNDYKLTHELWRRGHEIALHSITHTTNTAYWRSINASMWAAEIKDQREQMSTFAKIPLTDIRGMRAPFLQTGGDIMYSVLAPDFTWECSRPTYRLRNPGLWPYTNDYASIQDCQIEPCPVGRYPGFWTVPMVDLLGLDLFPCAMADTCTPTSNTSAEAFKLLQDNFRDHYNGNRAPFGVFIHASWFIDGTGEGGNNRKAGYKQFLDYLDGLPDVYIVSISQALDWIKEPKTTAQSATIPSWTRKPIKPDGCTPAFNCRFMHQGSERYMNSCIPCSEIRSYPWLFNHLGFN